MTARKTLDQMTSDELDTLHEQLEATEAERDELRAEITTAGNRLAEMARSRNEWQQRAETAERLAAHLAHALSNTFELPIDDVMTEAHNAIAAAWRTTDA